MLHCFQHMYEWIYFVSVYCKIWTYKMFFFCILFMIYPLLLPTSTTIFNKHNLGITAVYYLQTLNCLSLSTDVHTLNFERASCRFFPLQAKI